MIMMRKVSTNQSRFVEAWLVTVPCNVCNKQRNLLQYEIGYIGQNRTSHLSDILLLKWMITQAAKNTDGILVIQCCSHKDMASCKTLKISEDRPWTLVLVTAKLVDTFSWAFSRANLLHLTRNTSCKWLPGTTILLENIFGKIFSSK